MKNYQIITTGYIEGQKHEFSTDIESAENVKKEWELAIEEAEAIKADWDSLTVKLISYDVSYDQVSTDPELYQYFLLNEEVILEKTYSLA